MFKDKTLCKVIGRSQTMNKLAQLSHNNAKYLFVELLICMTKLTITQLFTPETESNVRENNYVLTTILLI